MYEQEFDFDVLNTVME